MTGNALAADLGLSYRARTTPEVDVALAVRNLGAKLGYGDAKDPLPSAVVAGVAARPLAGLSLDLDLIKYRDADLAYAVGGEYRMPIFAGLEGALRAGYGSQRKALDGTRGVALGAGLTLANFGFDFAWVPFGELGNTFRYSLLVRF